MFRYNRALRSCMSYDLTVLAITFICLVNCTLIYRISSGLQSLQKSSILFLAFLQKSDIRSLLLQKNTNCIRAKQCFVILISANLTMKYIGIIMVLLFKIIKYISLIIHHGFFILFNVRNYYCSIFFNIFYFVYYFLSFIFSFECCLSSIL